MTSLHKVFISLVIEADLSSIFEFGQQMGYAAILGFKTSVQSQRALRLFRVKTPSLTDFQKARQD
ncbi:MAG: hypothetical protein KME45_29520 [Stenomitos rutilans HA7619-LM2]|jgi:hypothetical protein|nr:hypothetical protein [Stenomitos rutilans HA7619-LM2]